MSTNTDAVPECYPLGIIQEAIASRIPREFSGWREWPGTRVLAQAVVEALKVRETVLAARAQSPVADRQGEQSGAAAPQSFETWAIQEGLISESHGVRFVNSMCDVACKAWYAALASKAAAVAVVEPKASAATDPDRALQDDLWYLIDAARTWERAYLDGGTLYNALDSYKTEVEVQMRQIENSVKKRIATPPAPIASPSEPVYDTSVVKRIATQMGWVPAGGESRDAVAEVESWTNGSYHRNYKLRWIKDVESGTKLYAAAQPSRAEVLTDEQIRGVVHLARQQWQHQWSYTVDDIIARTLPDAAQPDAEQP